MSLKPWWNYPAYDDPKYDTVPPPKELETSRAEQALDEDHLAAYARAVTNVLSTKLSESTFAQLIDGLPSWEVVYALGHYGLDSEEPVYKHRELCPGVLEKSKSFCADFETGTLGVRTDVLHRYQRIPVGSRASKLPLIELVAVAVHAIAARLFKQVDGGLHKNEKYPDDEHYKRYGHVRKKTTPFSLWRYDEREQYPHGNADIAAYWAEDQIFGGVVLFGRGESGTEVGTPPFWGRWHLKGHSAKPIMQIMTSQQNGVWFHSSRRGITDHVYALRDEQIASLLVFLESEPGKAESPFPILGDRSSLRRDWLISIPKYNIYRDRWERKIRFRSYWWYDHFQSKCRACDEDPVEKPERGHENEP